MRTSDHVPDRGGFGASSGNLAFLPGAIADHLTSAGGCCGVDRQMSSLRWLAAGATGTYGTVSDTLQPLAEVSASCRVTQALPKRGYAHRGILAQRRLADSGFVCFGEPLATPFRKSQAGCSFQAQESGNSLTVLVQRRCHQIFAACWSNASLHS